MIRILAEISGIHPVRRLLYDQLHHWVMNGFAKTFQPLSSDSQKRCLKYSKKAKF
jgi:hypothetical protein